jgi:hypothetical protein
MRFGNRLAASTKSSKNCQANLDPLSWPVGSTRLMRFQASTAEGRTAVIIASSPGAVETGRPEGGRGLRRRQRRDAPLRREVEQGLGAGGGRAGAGTGVSVGLWSVGPGGGARFQCSSASRLRYDQGWPLDCRSPQHDPRHPRWFRSHLRVSWHARAPGLTGARSIFALADQRSLAK